MFLSRRISISCLIMALSGPVPANIVILKFGLTPWEAKNRQSWISEPLQKGYPLNRIKSPVIDGVSARNRLSHNFIILRKTQKKT